VVGFGARTRRTPGQHLRRGRDLCPTPARAGAQARLSASALLAGLDVSGLDADGVRTVMSDRTTECAHSSGLQMALTACAGKLHDDGRGDDPADMLGDPWIVRVRAGGSAANASG